jgi:hypothetical protein
MFRASLALACSIPALLLPIMVCRPSAAQTKVGGHVGIATPFVTVSDETTTIADQFTLLNPIGIGFKVSEKLLVDFETVVATAVEPGGPTGLVVDPGVVYDAGPVAVGLRVAWKINARGNVGLIPLVNRGLVDFGDATWFAELALPTFFSAENVELNVVLHTGIGF